MKKSPISTKDIVETLSSTSISWALDLLCSRLKYESTPKTLAYLILTREAAREELDAAGHDD